MKQLFIIFLIFPITNLFAVSGPPDTMWTRRYGSSNYDCAYSIIQINDSNFIISGKVNGYASLIKIKPTGDTVWTYKYGNSCGCGYSSCQTQDGGFVIAGEIGTGSYDIFLTRTNTIGDTLWTKTYGGIGYDYASSLLQTIDGNFIIVGIKESGSTDIYIIKADCNGDTLWTKVYGGNQTDIAYSISQTQDSNFIIVGYTNSYSSGYDIYLIKINTNGDTLWTKAYGGPGGEYGYSICQTQDSNLIIVGETSSYGAGNYDVYAIKIKPNGDTIWTKAYGNTSTDCGYSVCQTNDGALIIAGTTYITGNYYDLYLIKIDLNGYAFWKRSYRSYYAVDSEYGHSICQDNNDNFMIAGRLLGSLHSYAYIVRFKKEPTVEENTLSPPFSCNSFPNPVISQFSIEYTLPNISNTQLIIYDVSGTCIKTFSNQNQSTGKHTLHWNGTNEAGKKMPAGIYFYTLTAGKYKETRKLILMK